MKNAVMGSKPAAPAPQAVETPAPTDTPQADPTDNVDPGTDDAGDVSNAQPNVPTEDTQPEIDETRFGRLRQMFGLDTDINAPAPEAKPADAAAPAAVADPLAEIEKGIEVADFAEAFGFDPENELDADTRKGVEKFVTKQNAQTKALVNVIREQRKHMEQLQGVAQTFQKQQDMALVFQANVAADAVAQSHPFFARKMGLWAGGQATKEQLATRNAVVKKAASLVAEGKAESLQSAIEAIAYGNWGRIKGKADNAQAKTPPPGGTSMGGSREPRSMREAVLGR